MDFCLLFLWCLLGARQTCGGAAGVLERRFWLSPVSGYLGGPFLCACCGLLGASGIVEPLRGMNILF